MATMVNVPKFFETELVTLNVTNAENNTKEVMDYEVTNLRLDEDYVFYYTFWTRLIITGAIPLIYLSTMNSLIFLAIKKKIPDYSRLRKKSNVSIKSQVLQNLNSKEGEEGEEEEGREIPKVNFPRNKSVTIVCIDLIFLICHFPRIFLNFYEGYYDVDLPENSQWCSNWINIIMSANIFLLTLNSSVNCLIYYLLWDSFNSVIIKMGRSEHHSETIM